MKTITMAEVVAGQRKWFESGKTRSVDARIQKLEKLREVMQKHEQKLLAALKTDLNKSEFDAYAMELGLIYTEFRHTIKHIRGWAKPRRIKTAMTHMGSTSKVISEPYGVAAVIAPWNYPVQLALVPLIGAIAAGNTVVLKPSELAPNVADTLAAIIAEAFEPEWATTVLGDAAVSTELLAEKLDYIFFTGSVGVGKIVMTAAAQHLTPVTLELGGKSPCIVHKDANLALAAKRIAFGKFTNAGQTCVAPDYLYVHREVKERFVKLLKAAIEELYGSEPLHNDSYTHIISDRHFARLADFMNDGRIIIGGEKDAGRRVIAPTVLEGLDWQAPVMQEEIFGPLLPLLEFDSIEEVMSAVAARSHPLALYLFTESTAVQQQVTRGLSFGGGCINDTLMHMASPHLPIGGVGDSGMGSYHGEKTFYTFSHQKSLLKQTTRFDMPFRYPTSKWGKKLIRKLLR